MARIGKALGGLVVLLPALALGAELEFSMSTDRTKVGTEDTFTVKVIVSGAGDDALVELPRGNGFEVLSRRESNEMSLSFGGGARNMRSRRVFTLTLRANKEGRLTIPPAKLRSGQTLYRTEPITLDVVKGRLDPERPEKRPFDPFDPFSSLPGFDDDRLDPFAADPFGRGPPASESDIFLRAELDKSEAFVGEQVTYTLAVFSRVDINHMNNVTVPKFEGFWSNDLRTLSQLSHDQQVIDGVPYRRYLLREKALFAMKPGTLKIDPATAELLTGFILQGYAVTRTSNPLTLTVKPLPGAKNASVGTWRLSAEVSQTEISLGEPLQLRVIAEGKGNLQALQLPEPQVPPAFRAFDPQVKDRVTPQGSRLGGTRIVEYVLMPQQTGTFTLPAMSLSTFDPEQGRYSESSTEPITLTVKPSADRPGLSPDAPKSSPVAKNQLDSGGLRPLRHTASFEGPRSPPWKSPLFVPAAVAPVGLSLVAALGLLVRRRWSATGAANAPKRRAQAAKRRLAEAERLVQRGGTADFYAEVDKAVMSFLIAKLGEGVQGLTRGQLEALMKESRLPPLVVARFISVLETCDSGRYAPGMGEATSRRRTLEEAAAAMEAWPS